MEGELGYRASLMLRSVRATYRRSQRYRTVDQLKHDYPNFVVRSHIKDHELRRLLGGEENRPRNFAKRLALRAYNLTNLETSNMTGVRFVKLNAMILAETSSANASRYLSAL